MSPSEIQHRLYNSNLLWYSIYLSVFMVFSEIIMFSVHVHLFAFYSAVFKFYSVAFKPDVMSFYGTAYSLYLFTTLFFLANRNIRIQFLGMIVAFLVSKEATEVAKLIEYGAPTVDVLLVSFNPKNFLQFDAGDIETIFVGSLVLLFSVTERRVRHVRATFGAIQKRHRIINSVAIVVGVTICTVSIIIWSNSFFGALILPIISKVSFISKFTTFILVLLTIFMTAEVFETGANLLRSTPTQLEEVSTVILRPFSYDHYVGTYIDRRASINEIVNTYGQYLLYLLPFFSPKSIIDKLVENLEPWGPIEIIGNPEKWTNYRGAKMAYFQQDVRKWGRYVRDVCRSSTRIIVIPGETDGLDWEIEMLLKEGLREKVIVFFPIQKKAERALVFQKMSEKLLVGIPTYSKEQIEEYDVPLTLVCGNKISGDKLFVGFPDEYLGSQS